MGQTDLQNLLDMGFDKERAELAMKNSGNSMRISRYSEWFISLLTRSSQSNKP
jgi:hypothetical protein